MAQPNTLKRKNQSGYANIRYVDEKFGGALAKAAGLADKGHCAQ